MPPPTPPPASAVVPPPPPPRPVWVRVFSAALKLAVTGLIVVAAWQLIVAYRGTFDAAPIGPPPTPPSLPTADADWLLESGGWSLGDSPWRATRSAATTAEKDARLSAAGDPTPPRTEHPLEAAVVAWVKQIDPAPVRDGRVTSYKMTVNRTTFRGVVEGTPDGDRLRLGQIAWPGEGGRWEMVELVPLTGVAAPAAEPLLPTPADTSVLARRWAGERVAAEVLGPLPGGRDTAAEWRAAGWKATPDGTAAAVVWVRGGDTRVVVRLSAPPTAPGGDYLLVFLPRPEAAR
ncbi:MAG: hypothetical protein MUF18_04025 [Fimbriiglobus sp.]|nr:hypothetical protein [Fimbriiglobus sp.]